MIALVERASVFSHLSAVNDFEDGKNLIDVVCAMEHAEHFKPYTARVGWILGKVAMFVPEEVQARRKVVNVVESGLDAGTLKKRAAKARQEAIMAQMKAQQASFAINFEDEAEEMEEMLEEVVQYGSCTVCQEDLNDSKPWGMLGLVQLSRLLRKHPDSHGAYLNELMACHPRSIVVPNPHRLRRHSRPWTWTITRTSPSLGPTLTDSLRNTPGLGCTRRCVGT